MWAIQQLTGRKTFARLRSERDCEMRTDVSRIPPLVMSATEVAYNQYLRVGN
jgi:hypothetical protein